MSGAFREIHRVCRIRRQTRRGPVSPKLAHVSPRASEGDLAPDGGDVRGDDGGGHNGAIPTHRDFRLRNGKIGPAGCHDDPTPSIVRVPNRTESVARS